MVVFKTTKEFEEEFYETHLDDAECDISELTEGYTETIIGYWLDNETLDRIGADRACELALRKKYGII